MTDQLDALQAVLTDVDEILRKRLAEIGVGVAHVLMAIDSEGSTIVRGNVLPAVLKEMGAELIDVAEEAMQQAADEGSLH